MSYQASGLSLWALNETGGIATLKQWGADSVHETLRSMLSGPFVLIRG